jgi:hypothetical protein
MRRIGWAVLPLLTVRAAFAEAAPPWLLAPLDAQSEGLAARLRPHLAERVRRGVVLPGEILAKVRAPLDLAPPETAEALAAGLEGAVRRYYYARDPAPQAAAIEKLVADALRLLLRLRERKQLWEAVRGAKLLLATDALMRNMPGKAAALCRLIASVDPAFVPPEADFAPKVRAVYAAERAKLPAERATLEVSGTAGMLVYVDGLPRGAAPLKLELVPGEHEVQGFAEGFLLPPERVAVRAPAASVRLEPPCHARLNLLTPRCHGFLRRLSGAAAVLRLAATGTRLRVQGWTGDSLARDVTVELPARLDARWLGELADFLAGVRQRPPLAELPRPSPPAPTPVYRRWWFWTIVGAVVAGGVAGAVLAPRGGTSVEVVLDR